MSCGPRHLERELRRREAQRAAVERQRQLWTAAVTGAVNGAVSGVRAAPGTSGQVRVGDTERESAVAALGEHFAAGRLSHAEFDERTTAAWSARTGGDLAPLFADLPALQRTAPPPRRRPRRSWRIGAGLTWVFVLLMVLAVSDQVPWLVVAIFAGLWWTGMLTGFLRWVHRRS